VPVLQELARLTNWSFSVVMGGLDEGGRIQVSR
jgi:hypothetical protein